MFADSSKRASIPKLSILEAQEDQAADNLDRLLKLGVDLENTDIAQRDVIRNIKETHASYEAISRKLADRYLSIGSVTRADDIREQRQRRRADVHDLVHTLKGAISNPDDISSVDLESTKRGRVQEFVDAIDTTQPSASVGDLLQVHVASDTRGWTRVSGGDNATSGAHGENADGRPVTTSWAKLSDGGKDRRTDPSFKVAGVQQPSPTQLSAFRFPLDPSSKTEFRSPSINYSRRHQYSPPYHRPMEQKFQTQQHCSLVSELNKLAIVPFDGKPAGFWSWKGRIIQRMSSANLSPLHQLLLLQENTVGSPRQLIQDHLHSRGEIVADDVTEIWSLLEERYGSMSRISEDLLGRLESFPQIRGKDVGTQLLSLYDCCKIVNFNLRTNQTLQWLNNASGLKVVRAKLPEEIQEEWRRFGKDYKMQHSGNHPPFGIFTEFLRKIANTWSDGDFQIFPSESSRTRSRVMVTSATEESRRTHGASVEGLYCAFHERGGHDIKDCAAFRRLPLSDRKSKIGELKLCFRCLGPHFIARCNETVRCAECQENHVSVMHPDGDEKRTLCTQLCSDPAKPGNCGKTVLVDVCLRGDPNKKLRVYAILDDQSNTSLVDERLVDFFGGQFPERRYTINFVSQKYKVQENGYLVDGLLVSSVKGATTISLPPILSTREIADTKHEVADPGTVRAHPHIRHLAENFSDIDPEAQVMLLIGRDCGPAMRCDSFSSIEPYACKTPLGWALVGRTCLDEVPYSHRRVLRTSVQVSHDIARKPSGLEVDPFQRVENDEDTGISVEDRVFLATLASEVCVAESGNLQLPVPLKEEHTRLPDNKAMVKYRTMNTVSKLLREPDRLKSCLEAMEIDLRAGFIEEVPKDEWESGFPRWFLPIFALAQRKGKTRLVFDASAKCKGVSLNDVMLQGPDLNNSLRGVLLRFREQHVGFVTDVSQMFKAFSLPPRQKDLYRFFWFRNNDPGEQIVQYRSSVHLFGARASPAIATYGLKYAARYPCEDQSKGVVDFISNNFYVDDGISSAATPEETIDIITGAQRLLGRFNIKLHKIMCSSAEVLRRFNLEDLAQGSHTLETKDGTTPKTLGVSWDPVDDMFSINVTPPERPFTKRGVLAVINSLFDPIGIVSPVILTGRLILRAVLPTKGSPDYLKSLAWDDPLPDCHLQAWVEWLDTLEEITRLRVPRCLIPPDFVIASQELHVYCDASLNAIGHVIYIRSLCTSGSVNVGLVEANSRVAPRAATTVPRLELCGAVEACVSTSRIVKELSRKPEEIFYYSDSLIVLAYLANSHTRFSRYVSRRVELIHHYSQLEKWNYIPSSLNPADLASRPSKPLELLQSVWTRGPGALWESDHTPGAHAVSPVETTLPETMTDVRTMRTEASLRGVHVFDTLCDKISSLAKIINIVANLMKFFHILDTARQRLGVHLAPRKLYYSREICLDMLIIRAQFSYFASEVAFLDQGLSLPGSSSIASLAPFMSGEGLIHVGGRVRRSNLPMLSKHPVLLPAKHRLTALIIQWAHESINHQGRILTAGAIRQAGFHVQKGSQMVRKLVSSCVMCRRLRGTPAQQLMADLPEERLEDIPPFSNVGMDVFGPFFTHDSIARTRRTNVTKKVWVLIVVCLVSRAVHLELLHNMETPTLMNAVRRFQAVRGCTKLVRTDRGSNFLGLRNILEPRSLDDVIGDMQDQGGSWRLHPPNASHFAGSWERKIRSVRAAFEGSLRSVHSHRLNRDDLATFLQEAAAIVNNTPLTVSSEDPGDPAPITPAHLLTLKSTPNPPSLDQFTERDLLSYGLNRWRRVQQVAEQFWQRWRTDYISTLQERQKWVHKKANLKKGDVVLIKDKLAPRNTWTLGLVENVRVSCDGLVRSVNLKLPPLPQNMECRFTTRCIQDVVFLFSSGMEDSLRCLS